MQCFVGTQKNRLNETLVFVCSNAYFCMTRTERKIFDSILFATKHLLAQATESSLWNVWNPSALWVEKSEYLNGSQFVDNQLRKSIGF